MDDVVDQLIHEVERIFKEQNDLPDELLSALYFVFGTPLQSALDFVDRKSVSFLSSPSGRSLFQVIGNSGLPYTCFAESNYCECPAYRFSVLNKEEFIMCKHVLAARLSKAMGLCLQQNITDEQMTSLLKAMN